MTTACRGQTQLAGGLAAGQRGFTLLLAALIASIVLALGTAVYSIAFKQVTLSSIGRDSQFAFYTADTMVECAFYHDLRYEFFDPDSPPTADEKIKCVGEESAVSNDRYTDAGGKWLSTVFRFSLDIQNVGSRNCATVRVTKAWDSSLNATTTVIHADGSNVSCNQVETHPRSLQRSVELGY